MRLNFQYPEPLLFLDSHFVFKYVQCIKPNNLHKIKVARLFTPQKAHSLFG